MEAPAVVYYPASHLIDILYRILGHHLSGEPHLQMIPGDTMRTILSAYLEATYRSWLIITAVIPSLAARSLRS